MHLLGRWVGPFGKAAPLPPSVRRAPGGPSAKLAGPHSVNPLGNDDLGMLAIANVAAENTRAGLPAHRPADAPGRAKRGWPRSRTQACCAGLPSAARLQVIALCRTRSCP